MKLKEYKNPKGKLKLLKNGGQAEKDTEEGLMTAGTATLGVSAMLPPPADVVGMAVGGLLIAGSAISNAVDWTTEADRRNAREAKSREFNQVGKNNYTNATSTGFNEKGMSGVSAFKNGGSLKDFKKLYKEGGKIHINPENKGKFNATKKATGETTEQLTHSKNLITRKRAIFAQNASKWNKKEEGGELKKLNVEDKINKFLDYPMDKAHKDASENIPEGEDEIDNFRHPMAARYTTEAIAKKTGNIPIISKGLGIIGSNALGIAHEIKNPNTGSKEKPYTLGETIREAGEDIFNNGVGSIIGALPLSNINKTKTLKYLSDKNLLPDGYGKSKDDMYWKDEKGKHIKINYKENGGDLGNEKNKRFSDSVITANKEKPFIKDGSKLHAEGRIVFPSVSENKAKDMGDAFRKGNYIDLKTKENIEKFSKGYGESLQTLKFKKGKNKLDFGGDTKSPTLLGDKNAIVQTPTQNEYMQDIYNKGDYKAAAEGQREILDYKIPPKNPNELQRDYEKRLNDTFNQNLKSYRSLPIEEKAKRLPKETLSNVNKGIMLTDTNKAPYEKHDDFIDTNNTLQTLKNKKAKVFKDAGGLTASYEAEDGEVLKGKPTILSGGKAKHLGNGLYKLEGNKHEEGGIKAKGGEFMLSDNPELSIDGKTPAEHLEDNPSKENFKKMATLQEYKKARQGKKTDFNSLPKLDNAGSLLDLKGYKNVGNNTDESSFIPDNNKLSLQSSYIPEDTVASQGISLKPKTSGSNGVKAGNAVGAIGTGVGLISQAAAIANRKNTPIEQYKVADPILNTAKNVSYSDQVTNIDTDVAGYSKALQQNQALSGNTLAAYRAQAIRNKNEVIGETNRINTQNEQNVNNENNAKLQQYSQNLKDVDTLNQKNKRLSNDEISQDTVNLGNTVSNFAQVKGRDANAEQLMKDQKTLDINSQNPANVAYLAHQTGKDRYNEIMEDDTAFDKATQGYSLDRARKEANFNKNRTIINDNTQVKKYGGSLLDKRNKKSKIKAI